MGNINYQNYENAKLSASLSENIETIKKIVGGSSDLLVNEVTISGVSCALICCEGMVSTDTIAELILRPFIQIDLGETDGNELFSYIKDDTLLGIDRVFPEDFGKLICLYMSGFAIILIDGCASATALGVQGYDRRGVGEPSAEENIKGSREGFVEAVRTNMGMIRRRMKSPSLKFELFPIGSRSKTDVCLVYFRDKVPKKMLDEIHRRLDSIELETILTTGYIEPFLTETPFSVFSEVGTTERPDSLCGKLLEGRVGLIVDGTPFVIVIPFLFTENFQTLDDYTNKPYYATLIRWIKYFSFAITILLPGVYVAIATFHPELLNMVLLQNLAGAEQSAPFSLTAEAFLMLVFYEIIREAGIRLPKAVGGAVSIVGGLIIGDAAVASGLISTPLLIIVALSVTASFVIPDLNQPTTVLRMLFVLAGGFAGLFGISLVLGLMLLNLCRLSSFGIPLAAPVSPFSFKAMRDVATRINFRKMQNGNADIEKFKE